MIIDHHVHLGEDVNKSGFSLSLTELIKKMNAFGIDKSVVFSCPNVVPSKTNPYLTENEKIYAAYQKEPSRIIPFMFVHPILDDLEYIKQNQARFKGFKVYSSAKAMEYSYEILEASKQMAFLASLNKPFLFHTSKADGGRIRNALNFIRSTRAPLAFAHSGRLFHEDLKEASKYPHVFVDIAPLATNLDRLDVFMTSPENRAKELKGDVEEVINYLSSMYGTRIIWGSDTPWCDRILENGYSREIDILTKLRKYDPPNSEFINFSNNKR